MDKTNSTNAAKKSILKGIKSAFRVFGKAKRYLIKNNRCIRYTALACSCAFIALLILA
jgi:hypothetical protein